MMHNRTRGFRYRSNGRGRQTRDGAGDKNRLRPNSFSNGRQRNNFKPYQSAEKLVEKYNALAKEALSSGDRSLSENYFQHADHYMRLIENKIDKKNLTQSQDKNQTNGEQTENKKNLAPDGISNQDQNPEVKTQEEKT
jgi:hypothetical protein